MSILILRLHSIIAFSFAQHDEAEDTDDEYDTDHDAGDGEDVAVLLAQMVQQLEHVVTSVKRQVGS